MKITHWIKIIFNDSMKLSYQSNIIFPQKCQSSTLGFKKQPTVHLYLHAQPLYSDTLCWLECKRNNCRKYGQWSRMSIYMPWDLRGFQPKNKPLKMCWHCKNDKYRIRTGINVGTCFFVPVTAMPYVRLWRRVAFSFFSKFPSLLWN